MRKVMAFGTFDVIHEGHIFFLTQSKKYGDYLIIVIARDKTVYSVKGSYPVDGEKIRKKNLQKLKIADKVLLGNIRDKHRIIRRYQPHIICLGYDQTQFTLDLEKKFPNIIIHKMPPYYPE